VGFFGPGSLFCKIGFTRLPNIQKVRPVSPNPKPSLALGLFSKIIEILGLEGESMNEKWTINPCRQGKLHLGVIPADRLGCFLLKTFFGIY
jgi:hypothetical protein